MVFTLGHMTSQSVRVEFLTRAQCTLCDEAQRVVAQVCAEAGVQWRERDIDTDAEPGLRERFSDYVPVVLVDGVQQAFWRVDADRLRRALAF